MSKYLFTILYIVSVLPLSSQTQKPGLIDTVFSCSYNFEWNEKASDFDRHIIREITKDKLKGLKNTKINTTVEIGRFSTTNDLGIELIYYYLHDLQFQGDIYYSGFELKEVLMPDEIRLYCCSGKQNKEYTLRHHHENATYDSILQIMPHNSPNEYCNCKLIYTKKAQERFDNFLLNAKDYLGWDQFAKKILDQTDDMRNAGAENTAALMADLSILEIIIKTADQWKFLTEQKQDPRNLHETLKILKRKYWQMMILAEKAIENEEQLSNKKFASKFSHYRIERELNLYKIINNLNPFHNTALINMMDSLGLFYTDGDISRLLFKGISDDKSGNFQIALYDSLESNYIRSSEQLFKENSYTEALAMLNRALLCNPDDTQSSKIKQLIAKTRYQIYFSYLKIAERSIQQKQYEFAANFIQKARNYQKLFSGIIILQSHADAICKSLIREKMHETGKGMHESIETLKSVTDLYKTLSKADHKLYTEIVRFALKTYDAIITKSVHLFNEKQCDSATLYLSEAIGIRSYLQEDIRQSNEEIELSKKLIKTGKGINLISSSTNISSTKLSEICKKKNVIYDSLQTQIKEAVALGKISSLPRLYETVNKHKGSSNICTDSSWNRLANTCSVYQVLADYAALKKTSELALLTNDYELSLSILLRMNDDKFREDLNDFNFTPAALIESIDEAEDTAFSFFCLNYFLTNEDIKRSLQCLDILRQQNVGEKETRYYQEQIAGKLAEKDKLQDIEKNPEEKLNLYVGDVKWYRAFRKSYIKNWKQYKVDWN